MKFNKVILLTALLASSFMAGCSDNRTPYDPTSSGSTSSSEYTGKVTVYFYIDFNQIGTGEYYATTEAEVGDKLTAPTAPQAPSSDFPKFLGWSYKELIKDSADLWDFNNTTIQSSMLSGTTLNVFGIWDVQ